MATNCLIIRCLNFYFILLNVCLVQREVDQQSEGGIRSRRTGRQWDHGSGAWGAASWKGPAEGGDPKTAGASSHSEDWNTGEILFVAGKSKITYLRERPVNQWRLNFCLQDLENQALAEAETWREQQAQLQEQQALQNRAKQEVEAEVERYKQVKESHNNNNKLKMIKAVHKLLFRLI